MVENQTPAGNIVRPFTELTDEEIVEMIRRNGALDTMDIANRFGLSVKDARRRLRRIEEMGAIRGKPSSYRMGKSGGQVLKWEAT